MRSLLCPKTNQCKTNNSTWINSSKCLNNSTPRLSSITKPNSQARPNSVARISSTSSVSSNNNHNSARSILRTKLSSSRKLSNSRSSSQPSSRRSLVPATITACLVVSIWHRQRNSSRPYRLLSHHSKLRTALAHSRRHLLRKTRRRQTSVASSTSILWSSNNLISPKSRRSSGSRRCKKTRCCRWNQTTTLIRSFRICHWARTKHRFSSPLSIRLHRRQARVKAIKAHRRSTLASNPLIHSSLLSPTTSDSSARSHNSSSARSLRVRTSSVDKLRRLDLCENDVFKNK